MTLRDAPALSMPALSGTPSTDTSAVQVRPNGEVVAAEQESPAVVNAPVTRWVKNSAPTTLWSSARADAAAFTDAPAGSFLRVTGPQENGRFSRCPCGFKRTAPRSCGRARMTRP